MLIIFMFGYMATGFLISYLEKISLTSLYWLIFSGFFFVICLLTILTGAIVSSLKAMVSALRVIVERD